MPVIEVNTSPLQSLSAVRNGTRFKNDIEMAESPGSSARTDGESVNGSAQIDQALLTNRPVIVASSGLDSAMIGLVKLPYKLMEKSLNIAFDYGARPMTAWAWKKGTDVARSTGQTTGWFTRKLWG